MLFFEKIVKYDAPYGRNVPLRGMCCFAECGRFAHQPKAAHWREATILHEVHHIASTASTTLNFFCNFAKKFKKWQFYLKIWYSVRFTADG